MVVPFFARERESSGILRTDMALFVRDTRGMSQTVGIECERERERERF